MNPAIRPIELQASDSKLLDQVIEFYHQRLFQHRRAQNYLQRRGILSHQALKTHRIGFADRDLARALPSHQHREGRLIRQRLMDLGIYRRKTGHGHFNGCVVFPVIDPEGKVREIYGRKITPNLRKGTLDHMYLPQADRPFDDRGIWNEQALAVHQDMILCESIIDALSFWVAGIQNVTTLYGTGTLSAYLLAAFKKYQTKTVLLAFDRDDSGAAAVKQHSQVLLEQGIDVYRIDFPAGMDANQYAVGCQADPGNELADPSLGSVIRTATWLGQGVAANSPTPETAKIVPQDQQATNGSQPGAGSDVGQSKLPTTKSLPAEPAIAAEIKDQEIGFQFGQRSYRVRGLEKNHAYDTLKINLLCRRGESFHVDTFDLYQSRPRAAFIKVASIELSLDHQILKRDLGQILLKLEQLQEDQIQSLLAKHQPAPIEMQPAARAAALELLQDENLLDRILSDFEACGVVGEEDNKLIGYLAAVSRKLNDPLAVLIQSSSAAGKSSLMDAVLSLVPPEDKVIYSAMTGQSLYYMGGGDLKHKILAISEEEGVRQASYALKLLQSEGSLRIASTGKDPNTGRMETQEYTVEGPVMLLLTTTAYDIDEELQNRCLTLSVCEDRSQTLAIHEVQRKRQTIGGLLSGQNRTAIQTQHQNAQRLLKPLLVANNWAEELKFRSDRTSTRRDHAKYLTLIRSIALLHQYQREIKTVVQGDQTIEYIEVTKCDIAIADRLSGAVLARSYEELPERTQLVLTTIEQLLVKACQASGLKAADFRFTRRELRTVTGLGNTQLKLHLDRLEDLEYIVRLKRSGSNPTIVYAMVEFDEQAATNDASFTGDEGLLRGSSGYPRK